MMEADSRDFSALERQMEHISAKLANHGELVTSIGRVVEKVQGGWTGFTASEKVVIERELQTEERCARQLCDSALVRLEIAYAQGLVGKAAVYVAPVAGVVVAPAVEAPVVAEMWGLLGRLKALQCEGMGVRAGTERRREWARCIYKRRESRVNVIAA